MDSLRNIRVPSNLMNSQAKFREVTVTTSSVEERLRAQNLAWMNVTRSAEFQAGQWEASLGMIPEVAATTLKCDRACVWWIDETKATCQAVYSQTSHAGQLEGGADTLDLDDAYISLLGSDRLLNSPDAANDSRLSVWKNYLRQADVRAALQVPFYRQGKLAGLLSCEEVGLVREWRSDEESFVSSLTDLILLALNERDRQASHQELLESQRRLAEELNEAYLYVRSLLPKPMEAGKVLAEWRFVSSDALGGDAFGYHWIDDDHFALYLLDVCGHGIGSALLSISAINVLRSQSLPETDFKLPDQVLQKMNEGFLMENQNFLYFTLWYGVVELSTRKLRYASAGHPAAFLFPSRSHPGIKLGYDSLACGLQSGTHFPMIESSFTRGSVLYLFSDGVFEIKKKGGGFWNYDHFVEQLRRCNMLGDKVTPLDHLMDQAKREQGESAFEDDYSIIRFQLIL